MATKPPTSGLFAEVLGNDPYTRIWTLKLPSKYHLIGELRKPDLPNYRTPHGGFLKRFFLQWYPQSSSISSIFMHFPPPSNFWGIPHLWTSPTWKPFAISTAHPLEVGRPHHHAAVQAPGLAARAAGMQREVREVARGLGKMWPKRLGFPARHGGTPIAGWFTRENHGKSHRSKWMMTGGTPPNLWKPHVLISTNIIIFIGFILAHEKKNMWCKYDMLI